MKQKTKTYCDAVLRECQSLQKECVFCLHLISMKIQVLAGKFTIVRQPAFSGFDINNNISRAEDFQLRDIISKIVKCMNLGTYMLYFHN